jgi:hypothetical protein
MSATTRHAAGEDQIEREILEREAQLEMQGYMAHLMKEEREREVDAMLAWWKRVTSQPHLEVTKMAMRLTPQERQALLNDLQAAGSHYLSDMPLHIYKFRADWMEKVTTLLLKVRKYVVQVRYVENREGDMEVELVIRRLGLDAMRSYCRGMGLDGLLMLQTIQPLESYTGERDESLSHL